MPLGIARLTGKVAMYVDLKHNVKQITCIFAIKELLGHLKNISKIIFCASSNLAVAGAEQYHKTMLDI